MQHPAHSTCTVNIVCVAACQHRRKEIPHSGGDGKTHDARRRGGATSGRGRVKEKSFSAGKRKLQVASLRLISVSRPTRGMEEEQGRRPQMAAKVLREWTHLLSGDRGAALVQRLQDRIGGDFPEKCEGDSGVDDGRNFYEHLTGGQNYGSRAQSFNGMYFSRVLNSCLPQVGS